ncbi:Shedu anti-phage system protein SduA domain-containing protein [Aeromonas salmonicida]|uniref:Shedu immune nuclease family protein n=1 Tax=Aeromonas salmonicida TaxID=645 RepID=UPI0039A759F2
MEPELVNFIIRPRITAVIRRQLVAISGSCCTLEGCRRNLAIGDDSFIGETAMIETVIPNTPRYNPNLTSVELTSLDNLILLCPTCHCLIDRQPEIYSADWLKKSKKKHLDNLRSILSNNESIKVKFDKHTEISLTEAVSVWRANKENSSEEFWQELLTKCPAVLSQVFPNSSFQFGAKCYVGGKNINNRQGNIVDFIYASKHTDNIVLIELKTPTKRLLGSKYRGNCYSISDELSGGIVQVLNYKEQLLKEYYKLQDDDSSFNAFSPRCIVLLGSLEREMDNTVKLKSFELFRNILSGVQVITFDEIFQKASDVLELVS